MHGDSRGLFFEWFTDRGFSGFAGHRLDVRQANCSVSSAGVLRGLHFAQLPPSQAKYVTCVSGAVFDVVVDIRLGSPTFGRWASVLLDDRDRRTIYISEGLAHGFLALQDDSTVMYLCSSEYNPQREHTIRATDPALGIDWPVVDGAAPACPTAMPQPPASTTRARRASCPAGLRRSGSSLDCPASDRAAIHTASQDPTDKRRSS